MHVFYTKNIGRILIITIAIMSAISISMWYTSRASASVPGLNYLVSQSASGAYANGASQTSYTPRLSHDGRYVAFNSSASNLVSNDINGYSDVFIKDTLTGTVTLVSLSPSGTQFTNNSYVSDMSYNGRYVLFSLMPAGALFVRDTVNNTTTAVFINDGGPCQVSGGGGAGNGVISADGRYVAYSNSNYQGNVYQAVIRDMTTDACRVISADSSGSVGNANSTVGGISCDGGVISFYTNSSNLPAGVGGYIAQFNIDGNLVLTKMPSVMSTFSTVSCNGNILATWTTNGAAYAINRLTGQVVTLASYHGLLSTSASVSISDDGRYAAITTNQDLDAAYPNTGAYNNRDVYVIDMRSGAAHLISFTVLGNKSGNVSSDASISADGNKVTYSYYTPTNTDSSHEIISGLTSGTSSHQSDVYTSETGF